MRLLIKSNALIDFEFSLVNFRTICEDIDVVKILWFNLKLKINLDKAHDLRTYTNLID